MRTHSKRLETCRLTRLNLIALVGIVLILLVAIIYSLIAYTNIRELIPGYPDAAMRQNIRQNAMKLDSLEYEQAIRDQYFDNLKRIISGEVPENYMNDTSGMIDAAGNYLSCAPPMIHCLDNRWRPRSSSG